MDPHTARCLQLSTTISMPYAQHHRRNAIAAESMNRSRFPVNSSPVQQPTGRPMPQRSSTMPSTWMPTTNMQAIQPQQPFAPINTAMNTFGPPLYQDSPITSTPGFDTGFYPMQGQDVDLSLKTDGLGMHFIDNESEFGSMTFSATTESFDDLIRLDNTESSWLTSSPLSPDRRSISSASDGDNASELPDLEMSSMQPQTDFINSIEMPTLEENVSSTSFQHQRRARSMSRPPAARSSSNRRFRRTPYTVGHTRSNSVMSNASVMSYQPMSMPGTGCCTPVTEYDNNYLFQNYQAEPIFEANKPMDHFFSADEPLIAPKPMYSYDNFFLNADSFDHSVFDAQPPMVLPSSGMTHDSMHLRNPDHGDYADEPDLFGALSEEQSVPPEEDMKPEDPDMEPQEQEVRFEGDLYTPRFVRGHGNKREGYCGLCKPGRWLVLKNSAFWYDKSFTHGISAATGQPFDAPKETRRMSGNPDVWEGLCGTCDEWIALISNKKKGTSWFRHAYKCHNHPKSKDNSKKRRETVSSRAQSKSRAPIREAAVAEVETSNVSSGAAIKTEYTQHQVGSGLQPLQTISALI